MPALLPGGGAVPAAPGRCPAVAGVQVVDVGAVEAVLDQPISRSAAQPAPAAFLTAAPLGLALFLIGDPPVVEGRLLWSRSLLTTPDGDVS
ncbi:hypothetical protein [Streptomyces cinerochromogenes]|uniref:hypothetical protein n=1 Tax=Streptomyces cinerochromogenes TaxID=66422 RepID=UPI0033BAC9D3